jgi:hypothetical protein
MHDTMPMTDGERALVDVGRDPCIPVLRVYLPQ